jgi:hypothetical protein
MGQSPAPVSSGNESSLPPDVVRDDGITEHEAVELALWNNAQFAALLSDLGISRAQLYNAGLLADPELVIFFPVGPKQLEFTAYQAIDSVWLRPIRVHAAARDMSALAEQMVDNGLNLIRDVRAAHADLVFAQDRLRLAEDVQKVRTEIADLGQKRLDAGDISQLEAASSRIESLRAKADQARWQQDVLVAESRLRELLGLSEPLVFSPMTVSPWVVKRTSSPSSTNQTGATWTLPCGEIHATFPVRVPSSRKARRSSSVITVAISGVLSRCRVGTLRSGAQQLVRPAASAKPAERRQSYV